MHVPNVFKLGRLFLFFAVFFVAIFSFTIFSPNMTQANSNSGSEDIVLFRSDANGLELSYASPALERTEIAHDLGTVEFLDMADLGHMDVVGHPNLPQKGFMMALPPGAEAQIASVDSRHSTVRDVLVLPAEKKELAKPFMGDVTSFSPEFVSSYPADSAMYEMDGLFPAGIATLSEPYWFRDQRVVNLTIYPVQANSAQRTVQVHESIDVTIEFSYPAGQPTSFTSDRPESNTYEAILASSLLNYEAARDWRQLPPTSGGTSASPCLDNNAFRITVQETGLYRLTRAELDAAGLSGTVSSNSIRMCHLDEEIRIKVNDGGDGNFGAGDSVTFYGEAIKTQETENNIYWFTYGGANGLRIAVPTNDTGSSADTSHSTVTHVEQDLTYRSTVPMTDANDHWYWTLICANGTDCDTSIDLPFTANNTSGSNATIQVETWGTQPISVDHRVGVYLNGVLIGTEDYSATRNTFNLFAGAATNLNAGSNTLTVEAQNIDGSFYQMIVNWAEITYEQTYTAQSNQLNFAQDATGDWAYSIGGFSGTAEAYDVTDPHNPVEHVTTGSGTVNFEHTIASTTNYAVSSASGFLSVSDVVKDTASNLAGSNTADYIIITAPLFDGALAPLVSLRQSEGLTVKTVYVQDIFDEFGYGLYDTNAIRDFLEYAYGNWSGGSGSAPTYALLAGEGSYDHRNVSGDNGSGDNLVPVYLQSGIDSFIGEAASDNRYVAWDDANPVAQMMLGRLPAKNTTEMSRIIDKILFYEDAPINPVWHASHFLVADNTLESPLCGVDPAGDFFGTTDTFINNFINPISGQLVSRVYAAPVDCYPGVQPPHYIGNDVNGALENVFAEGHQFVIYTGHSTVSTWGKPGENFIELDEIFDLDNGNEYSIMLPMTCLEGIYHYPNSDDHGISETLLRLPDVGAVASYAPTGLQVLTAHDLLIEGLYDFVYSTSTTVTLGEGVIAAKVNLDVNGSSAFQDLHDTFMLLGDPAMNINTWQSSTELALPIIAAP